MKQTITAPDSPQAAFQAALEIEADLASLTNQLPTLHPSARRDTVVRMVVATEGISGLFGYCLQATLANPDSLPFRDRWESVLDASLNRQKALQGFVVRGDFTPGALMNVAKIIEGTEKPIRHLVDGLRDVQAVGLIQAFLMRFGGSDDC